MDAAHPGDLAMLDLLHQYGEDVNAVAKDGCTALLGAGNNGQALAVKRMLRHGVDVHGTPLSEATGTPLYSAIIKGYISVVRVLLEAGALEPRFTEGALIALMLGSLDDDAAVPMLKVLLQHWGTDVNTVCNNGTTLILAAVMCKQLKAAGYLVSAGADLQVKDVHGNTLVHAAAQCDAVRILRWLVVTQKLNPCEPAADSWLPLHCACQMGCSLAAEEYLLSLPQVAAMLAAEDSKGYTALQIAADSEHDDMVQLLLSKGAAVDARSHTVFTPLMQAQRLCTVTALVNAHADVNAVDDDGFTVLHHCADQGTAECVYKLLLQHGAVPAAVDKNGSTPAHIAGMSGHFADEALLSKAADDYRKTHANDAAADAVSSVSSSEQKRRDVANDTTSSGSGSSSITNSSGRQGASGSSNSAMRCSGSSEAAATADSEAVGGSVKQKKKVKQPCANVNCKKLTTKLCRRCVLLQH
jgi:ankyrin repeat protein